MTLKFIRCKKIGFQLYFKMVHLPWVICLELRVATVVLVQNAFMIDDGTAWKLAYKFVNYGLVHNANIACTKLNNFSV